MGEVEQWKQLAQDRRRSEDLSSLMAKMEVREGEVAGLRVEHAGREEEIKRRKVVNKAEMRTARGISS